jgi:hypothetical protein
MLCSSVFKEGNSNPLTYRNVNCSHKLPCLSPPVVRFRTQHDIVDLKHFPSGFPHIVVVGETLPLLPYTRASLPAIAESVRRTSFRRFNSSNQHQLNIIVATKPEI